jgi:hypothetical protein
LTLRQEAIRLRDNGFGEGHDFDGAKARSVSLSAILEAFSVAPLAAKTCGFRFVTSDVATSDGVRDSSVSDVRSTIRGSGRHERGRSRTTTYLQVRQPFLELLCWARRRVVLTTGFPEEEGGSDC